MNPFEEPKKVSVEIDNEVRELIKEMFSEKGKLDFHDMLRYFEGSVKEKDLKRSKIAAYYCTNVVMSQPTLTEAQRNQLILGFKEEINRLEIELNGEDPGPELDYA